MNSREKILRCARELFHEVGYQATSVDVILRRCGVVKSNFYYHFKTKDDLANAVLDLQASEYEALAAETLHNREIAPSQRLSQFCEQLCRAQSDVNRMAGCPFGNFAAEISALESDERAEQFRIRLGVFFDRLERQFAECLQEGSAQGGFRSDLTSEELARALLAAIEGHFLLTKTRRDPIALRNGLQIALRLLQEH